MLWLKCMHIFPLVPRVALVLFTPPALAAGQPVDAKIPLKIVSFGTSLTKTGGWQRSLQGALSACFERPVEIFTVAFSGASSDWAVAHTSDVIALRPDIVLVEFYANDAAINRWMTVNRSRANIVNVLERLTEGLPGVRIIFTKMNPFLGLSGYIRPFLGSYVSAHLEEARLHHMEFVDYSPSWRTLSDGDLHRSIPDGSHPLPEAASSIIVPTMTQYLCGGKK